MAYRYEFDSSSAGDFRRNRANYEILHEGFRLLCKKLEVWNKRTVENRGAYPPYEKEVEDLRQLIDWGDGQLAQANVQDVIIRGVSVGNLRYVKAALIFVIQNREQEYAQKAKEGWPGEVLKSFADGIEHVRTIARGINCEPSDILWEIMPKEPVARRAQVGDQAEWDVFVSHASEDKEAFARPLAKALQSRGLKVWFDEFTLTVGDSLRQSIDRGLADSKFGIVVISPKFLRKNWPQKELDGLVAREVGGVVGAKVILPVWHGIGADEIRAYSPTLADRVAVSSTKGLGHVIAELMRAICPEESAASLEKYTIDDANRQPSSIPPEASAAEYFPSVSAPRPGTLPRPSVVAPIPTELRRPRLTVEISKYQPPDSGQMRGDVSFTLRNAGYVEFKVVRVRTQSGNTQNDDLTC